MDVATSTSVSAYSYQSTLQSSGQAAAVLQALNTAYSHSDSNTLGSSDPLASLAGASAVGSLVSGITTLTQASTASSGGSTDTQGSAIPGLSDATYGGLDTNSATALLASMANAADTSGLQGFDTAVTGSTDLAIAAYQAQQSYPVSTPAAQTSPSSTPTTTVTSDTGSTTPAVAQTASATTLSQDPNSTVAIQQAVAAALNPSSLSLLA